MVIYAGTRGYLDTVEVSKIARYQDELLANMKSAHAEVLADIRTTKALSADTEGKLKAALEAFGKTFA